jgi:N6-L-threonylcarbamoyladenine synthase
VVKERSLRILGIETSCDETAASVVEGGSVVCSSVVASQADRHARFGGVVPEIASRLHVDVITDVIARALVEGGFDFPELDAVAATHGPGLAGALLVGVSAAKAIAVAQDIPYIGVNHLEAHLYAAFLEEPDIALPMVVLLASGGHTLLVHMLDHGKYEVLGQTVDDAAGECFDKIARFVGLGYPGGPAIDRLAMDGDPHSIRFPRPMLDEGFDFSFSGLKTAVINHVRAHPDDDLPDLCASVQEAIVDTLVIKLMRAAKEVDASAVVIGGGVAANTALRTRVLDEAVRTGVRAFVPARSLCTDNAAMIASVAWWRLHSDGPTSLASGAFPNLRLPAMG